MYATRKASFLNNTDGIQLEQQVRVLNQEDTQHMLFTAALLNQLTGQQTVSLSR
jgi:hypothetical protein